MDLEEWSWIRSKKEIALIWIHELWIYDSKYYDNSYEGITYFNKVSNLIQIDAGQTPDEIQVIFVNKKLKRNCLKFRCLNYDSFYDSKYNGTVIQIIIFI